MEQQNLEQQPIIIAMKGHPGTGKSTLAHSIASSLKCPLIDKDHVRDCTQPLQQALFLLSSPPVTAHNLLNDLSYEILFQMGSTQVGLGLSVVIDSPLSRRTHLERLEQLAAASGARIVIVECKPSDVSEWRRRLERRGEADGSSWHKPATWPELERLVEGYGGCTEYDVGDVPKVVVDTTAAVGVEEQVAFVLEFIASSGDHGGRGSFCPS